MKNICVLLLLLFFLSACSDQTKGDLVDPYLTVELESNVFNVPIGGKMGTVKIRTNLSDWKLISKKTGGYDWCQTSIGLSASDIYLLTFNVAPNEGVGRREAEFILAGNGVESISLRVVQLGSEPEILVDFKSKLLSKEEQTFTVKVTANVEYTFQNEEKWLTLKKEGPNTKGMVESEYQYSVTDNSGLSPRKDTIRIKSVDQMFDKPIVVEIPIEQKAADIDDVTPDNIKVKVESVEMVQGTVYSNEKPDLTIDGNLTTTYSSAKLAKREPVILEYKLQQGVEKVDYVVLHQNPKASVNNQLTKGKIEYQSVANTEWTECGSFEESRIVPSIQVDVNVVNPTRFRLTLERTPEPTVGNVSLAEFECNQKADVTDLDLIADAAYFEDNVFSRLKPTTTQNDISRITHPMIRSVAQELLNNRYSSEFRVRTYQSCQNPEIIAKELTIGKRSICDNPMGLFFEKNKKYFIFVGNEINGNSVNLYIRDWREEGGKQTIELKSGLNTLEAKVDGMGYIQYWTDKKIDPRSVKIHVCFGNEMGFWDKRAGHKNEDWKRILNLANTCAQRLNIVNAMLDVVGEHVQLINTVQDFNTYCPNDIESIVNMHDELMLIEYSVMGLVKNKAVPRNRMLGVRSWGGSPNWNGTSANFPKAGQNMLDKGAFLRNIWVFGHEFGHGNQLAQMKGASWTETTNNLYAQHAMYLMNNKFCRLEHTEYKRKGYEKKMLGDRFNAYIYDAIVQDKTYLTHEGGLKEDERGTYYEGDHFVKLAPLWQLSLFFMFTEGTPWYKPDFWPDVHWAAIQNEENTPHEEHGQRYVDFMKRCMKASDLNLTDFFENMGLLREINMKVDDYGSPKQVTITKAMVEEVKEYGKSMNQPSTPVIHYISGNSLNTYKNQLSVQGSFNQGISEGQLSKTISHDIWKNVVAFETYKGNELVEVCIVGTGSLDNSSTYVRYPQGATCIKAVSWDGKRKLVCGTCNN